MFCRSNPLHIQAVVISRHGLHVLVLYMIPQLIHSIFLINDAPVAAFNRSQTQTLHSPTCSDCCRPLSAALWPCQGALPCWPSLLFTLFTADYAAPGTFPSAVWMPPTDPALALVTPALPATRSCFASLNFELCTLYMLMPNAG